MPKNKSYRMQVIMSEEMREKLERYSNMTGVSMSALCNVFIGQGLMGYDKAFQLLEAEVEGMKKGPSV